MKSLLIAAAVASVTYGTTVSAGEDSTDRFGQAGNGVQIWSTNCGLVRFQGQTGNRDERRPCGRYGLAYDASGSLLPTAGGTGSNAKPAAPVLDRGERDEK
jgi:hypothetical protein